MDAVRSACGSFRQSLEKAQRVGDAGRQPGPLRRLPGRRPRVGLLVAGTPEPAHSIQVFFLTCVVVAAVFGAATVSRSILVVQGLPAALALLALWLSRG